MVKCGQVTQFEYLSAFWDRYFFAYLDYAQVQAVSSPLTASRILTDATAAA